MSSLDLFENKIIKKGYQGSGPYIMLISLLQINKNSRKQRLCQLQAVLFTFLQGI